MSPLKNVKVKLLFLTSILAIILIISAPVVNSVLVNLVNPTETVPLSSSVTVFVDPDTIIKDYELDPGYQIGDTFTVHVNISGVSDLFTWQLNMSWDPSILNISSINAADGFLTQSVNDTSSEALGGVVINATNNVEGYAGMAESILANVSGVTGSGRLVSINFTVTGYGYTNLALNDAGTLPTMLLNSTGDSVGYTIGNGWFDNRLRGDADGDGYVDIGDMGVVSDHWGGPPAGVFPYARFADLDDDTVIDIGDMGIVSDNWNRGPVP